jgi:omega-6 fatty acid desaturase (delta-12 desaturase)
VSKALDFDHRAAAQVWDSRSLRLPAHDVSSPMHPAAHQQVAIATAPSRKEIRSWLLPLERKSTAYPLALLAIDLAIFVTLIVGAVALRGWLLQLACALVAGFWIGRLFILGHDACHQAYTPGRTLNRVLGRIAFLPSLTPYSLWEVGHNVVHHGYTNLKGVDFVWAPLSPAEFAALSPTRKLLERVYRSGWGCGAYYLVEMWWRRMFFPNGQNMPTRRAVFLYDNLLASAAALAWTGALLAYALLADRSVLATLAFGFAIPFLFWNAMIGFVVYVHHTHEQVRWYDDKKAWAEALPFVSTTVHLTFPARIGALLHHIMEHTAHHVSMSVPLYHLRAAQKLLEEKLTGAIIIQRFSWRWYFRTARRCKLYDFAALRWTDFKGRAVVA